VSMKAEFFGLYLPHIIAICFAVDYLVDLLMCK